VNYANTTTERSGCMPIRDAMTSTNGIGGSRTMHMVRRWRRDLRCYCKFPEIFKNFSMLIKAKSELLVPSRSFLDDFITKSGYLDMHEPM